MAQGDDGLPSHSHRYIYNLQRWKRLRRTILDRDGWRCQSCGRAGRLEVHHKTPVREGGAIWDPANLTTLCYRCHVSSHHPVDADVQAWREFAHARA